MTSTQPQPTTSDAGIPVESDEHSLTVGPDGPILLQDHYLIEQMAQWNRERVPERQPHAKGSGAFGRFEVTHDVSAYTTAAVFQPGTTTELVVRFSTVAGERGSPDTWRDPRGFAIKFYTTQGNYDLVGNNTPVFFIRDPIKFPDFIRSQKRRADNHLRDNDMQWDFWTLRPESAHQVTWLMGDRGIPSSWRNMNGYGSHTHPWPDGGRGEIWGKDHLKNHKGIGCPTPDEMLLGRLFSYPDAHGYRIGTNYAQLPVNAATSPVNSYSKDGAMRYENPGDPVYAPNTVGGPHADPVLAGETASAYGATGELLRAA